MIKMMHVTFDKFCLANNVDKIYVHFITKAAWYLLYSKYCSIHLLQFKNFALYFVM